MTRIKKTLQKKTTRKSTLAGRLLLAALLVLFAGAVPATADTPAQGQFGEEVDVDEVLLDVLVTDGDGNVVVGLDEDDFVVEEDGEPMEVTGVSFYSNRQFLESSQKARELGIDPNEVPTNRYFILFFHNQRRVFPRLTVNLLDAGRRAKQWVMTDLQPNDYVAVVSYDPKLNVQDFTNDRQAIANAIDEAVQGVDFGRKEAAAPEGVPSLTANLPAGEADRIYEALEMVAEGAGEIRGRKNLVFFSIGFGEPNTFGLYRPDARYYPDTVHALNDNNVAVYSVDLLASNVGFGFQTNFLESVLSQLSNDTGGEFYFNFVNFLTPLEQVSQDTNGYYLVSFKTRHEEGEKGYQEVSVETTNPELETRTRQGYVYGNEMEEMKMERMAGGR